MFLRVGVVREKRLAGLFRSLEEKRLDLVEVLRERLEGEEEDDALEPLEGLDLCLEEEEEEGEAVETPEVRAVEAEEVIEVTEVVERELSCGVSASLSELELLLLLLLLLLFPSGAAFEAGEGDGDEDEAFAAFELGLDKGFLMVEVLLSALALGEEGRLRLAERLFGGDFNPLLLEEVLGLVTVLREVRPDFVAGELLDLDFFRDSNLDLTELFVLTLGEVEEDFFLDVDVDVVGFDLNLFCLLLPVGVGEAG